MAEYNFADQMLDDEFHGKNIDLLTTIDGYLSDLNDLMTTIDADTSRTNLFTATGTDATDLLFKAIEAADGVAAEIVDDTVGYHYYLMGLFGTADGLLTFQIREKDDAPIYSGAMSFGANGGPVMPVTGFPYAKTADSKGMEIITTGDNFNGTAIYLKVAN